MAENISANGEGAPQAAAQPAPRLSIVSQYVKDMSFENPRAPQGLQQNTPPRWATAATRW